MKKVKMSLRLPCEKVITFTLPYGADEYITDDMCDKYPSNFLMSYYLLYVPELKEYSGDELFRSMVVDIDYCKY